MADVAGRSACPRDADPACRQARRPRAGPPRRVRSTGANASCSLREGSIIVVTIVVAIYFAATPSSFFTTANFKTLLPYFAPFAILGAGEVFVMILGEIDLSIGAIYLFAPDPVLQGRPAAAFRSCRA